MNSRVLDKFYKCLPLWTKPTIIITNHYPGFGKCSRTIANAANMQILGLNNEVKAAMKLSRLGLVGRSNETRDVCVILG